MPKRVHIRRLVERDLPQVLAWRNHPSVRSMMFTSREIGPEEHRAWFEKANSAASRRLLIAEADGSPFGFIQFDRVEIGGVSDWGFYARPGAPKGKGQALGLAALDHAFFELQLHKVCGQALTFNEGSIRLHQRLGFHQEGLLRDQHRADGAYHPVIHFGLLRSEWPEAKKALLSRTFTRHRGSKE
ncbi:UDP-4-amino-4,6-dideoxy-N-acetyl-beta-L-altrosamine N-acetyltransferase [Thioclava sp. DLFJ5-1]|uniref:UDP-4-amino-4, 6-dideoxy-N-acetyl-beta-L-altrosamine N-acetyltransferase n=1 Tax=Thioclava sp. DLFJ5-1 TaxID=1915314 RepID=UPI0009969FAD|nr:UDP-4-amino-4,6-dideoxy-N-acetyl-beta-L-altrosamine N-acetyltransferase [Thioclava sp. DLFJ5-1]OOY22030.1 UDP-4-amino-4,6-dideoxy-N-acetyl-beta-L-altrosamine N-acetyltransferase [Thioclava sp. DLFJ5-1]